MRWNSNGTGAIEEEEISIFDGKDFLYFIFFFFWGGGGVERDWRVAEKSSGHVYYFETRPTQFSILLRFIRSPWAWTLFDFLLHFNWVEIKRKKYRPFVSSNPLKNGVTSFIYTQSSLEEILCFPIVITTIERERLLRNSSLRNKWNNSQKKWVWKSGQSSCTTTSSGWISHQKENELGACRTRAAFFQFYFIQINVCFSSIYIYIYSISCVWNFFFALMYD